jgi:hypothetical protein
MAAANPNRSWLPEMLEMLKKEWNSSLSWEQLGALCERLTELRNSIRKATGIKGPRMFCRHCNEVHEMEFGPVTIRSGLFALKKHGLVTNEELTKLDVDWRRYRAKHRLDGCARKKAEPLSSPRGRAPGGNAE